MKYCCYLESSFNKIFSIEHARYDFQSDLVGALMCITLLVL